MHIHVVLPNVLVKHVDLVKTIHGWSMLDLELAHHQQTLHQPSLLLGIVLYLCVQQPNDVTRQGPIRHQPD